MPFVDIKTLKGVLTEELKKEIHQKIAEVMVQTEGRGKPEFAQYVTIMIEELEPENCSVAGQQATEQFIEHVVAG